MDYSIVVQKPVVLKRLFLFLNVIIVLNCKKSPSSDTGGGNTTNPPINSTDIVKGADVSWLTQMENADMNDRRVLLEPESYGNWQGYTLGAFDNSGRPTIVMNAFK